MNEEIQAHIDGLTERGMARGLSRDEARYAALREFGGVTQVVERARDQWRSLWLEQLAQDLRYAIRSLAKSPSFAVTTILTLALGIGVNTALFSVFNMVTLRPLPLKDPDSLVRIIGRSAKGDHQSGFSYDEYVAYRENNRSLEGLLAIAGTRTRLQRERDAVSGAPFVASSGPGTVPLGLVSENYFEVLGGSLQLGRNFLPEECVIGAAPVIILSHFFWQRHFHGDPNVLGARIALSGQRVTVVGVASAEFSGDSAVPPAGWLPLTIWSNKAADYAIGGPPVFHLVGRIKPGGSEDQAKADFDRLFLVRAEGSTSDGVKVSSRLERGMTFVTFNRSAGTLIALGTIFVGFGMVLVIACTNVANLLLARGISRQPEIGMRLTLGASRGRIVRQLFTENALICGLGALVGLGFSVMALYAVLPLVMARLPMDWVVEARGLPLFTATPDIRVLGFTAFLMMVATLVAGLVPALHASGVSLVATVRNETSALGVRLSPSRLRKLLVVAQVAICLTLLSCASLMARNFFKLQALDTGFEASAVFGVGLTLNPKREDRAAAFREALEALQQVPGVASAAVARGTPFLGPATIPEIRVDEVTAKGKPPERVFTSFVSEEYFRTFGIPLVAGRTFHPLELTSTSRVIIVSETLARQRWPGQVAVGKFLQVSETAWASNGRSASERSFRECEVIGVVRDVTTAFIPPENKPDLLYLPFVFESAREPQVFVRPVTSTGADLAEIEQAADRQGVGVQFGNPYSFWVQFHALPYYGFATVGAALAALALGIASVGLYGMMTFVVSQRVREVGVRVALGATTENVVKLFVRQGMWLVAVGVAVGLIGGILFALAISKIFFGLVDAFDPVAFGSVTLLFAVIGLLACWLPARRAAKVDPNVALRAE